ncbi:phage tail tape measure protein [Limnobaculum zhutongyuii]|uniref:Phage tail tape measure protein n=1 Tax=Limnobaculum zhutongyuii TaxID=2498113 RepID=A0A411WMH1_9GAMM|nr:phage tail tape measure protein [Limnobaculum zhutongyuii]QBH97340.1 phage tail tape measure protein [Limnobaculum zhutongyuii]TQS90813.1 phage tail tape measure protein [Limnobaculum zhutongyuii]
MTDRRLNIKVAFSALNNMARPVSAARNAAAGLATQIRSTQNSIKALGRQASSFDKLNAATKRTGNELTQAKEKARQMAAAFGPLKGRTAEQTAALIKQRAAVRALTQQQTQQQTRLNQLRADLYRHGISVSQGTRATDQIRLRTEQYNRQLAEQQRRLNNVTQAQSRYNRSKETGSKLTGAGMKSMMVGGTALYGSARFLSPGVDFDRGMSKVQALTRLDKNSEELKVLRSEARRLGAETEFTSTDASRGQQFLAMAGFTPQAIKQALPGVLNMALAGDMDLGESADIGSNVLSQFKLSADQMDRVSDVLTGAFTRTNTDLRQLSETMVYAGPVAATLGIDIETMAAMAGSLADKGIRGSMAGTSLRASLSRLAAPTKKAQAALDELGISVNGAGGKMRPMEEILTDLYNKTRKYSQTSQVSFFKHIGGEEAFTGLMAAAEAAGNGKLQGLIKELRNAAGEADKNAKTMGDNLLGDFRQLDSAWESVRIHMEESIDSPLRGVTQGLTRFLDRVEKWMKENPELTKGIAKTVLIVGALAVGIGAVTLALGMLLGPMALVRLSLTTLTGGAGFGGVMGAITKVGGVLRTLLSPMALIRTVGQATFGPLIAIIAGISAPIWLVIAVIVAAAVAIIKFWEPIKAFFSGFFSGLMAGLAPVKSAFAPLAPIFDAIGSAIGGVWEWFQKLLEPIHFSTEELNACTSAGQWFGEIVGKALSNLVSIIVAVASGIGWLLEKLGAIPSAADAAVQATNAMNVSPFGNLVDGMTALSGVGGNLGKTPVTTKLIPPQFGVLNRLGKNDGEDGESSGKGGGGGLSNRSLDQRDPNKLGDIVFKNVPAYIPIRGGYTEPMLQQRSNMVAPYSVQQPTSTVGSQSGSAIQPASSDQYNINIYISDARNIDEAKIAQRVRAEMEVLQQATDRRRRSSLLDRG